MDSPESPFSGSEEADDLSGRVDELERALAEQRRRLEQVQAELRALRSAVGDPAAPPSAPESEGNEASAREASAGHDGTQASSTDPSAAPQRRLGSWAPLRSEDWLNYVGIGLFLFGVAFLLRYTIEQGWLVPPVRVGLGGVLGAALLGAGLRLPAVRRRLRQVLLGGSGASFYATVFAAHQLYDLVPYSVAFGGMGIVTVVTAVLAVREEEAILALVGVLGGLGTPFLLYAKSGGFLGLALYLCAVLGGACAVFWVRGWRSLIYTTVGGGWAAFFVAVVRATAARPLPPDRWALQAGIGIAWVLLAGTPVLRALARRRAPDEWPVGPLPRWLRLFVGANESYGLVVASPLLAVVCSRLLWQAPDGTWPLVAGVGAAIYGGAYVGLRRVPLPGYASGHGLVAAVMAAYGLAEALGGATLLVAWSVEAILLLGLAGWLGEPPLRRAGHVLFAVVAGGLAFRLSRGAGEAVPLVGAGALSELAVLGLGAAAATFVELRSLRWGYRGGALVGWLGWTVHELAVLPHGHAYVSLLWGATAAALLVAGAWGDRRPLQVGGLAVLAAFVAKLFLVDLASLPPLWRIVLFLGSGAAFLGVSYLLPGLLPRPVGPTDTSGG